MAVMSCRSDLEPWGDIAACTRVRGSRWAGGMAAVAAAANDHPAATARTRMRECLRFTLPGAVGITGRFLWCRHVKQPARSRDVFRAPAIGEQAVMTDAVETVGQNVDQKAADELVDVECHQLVAVV